MDATTAHLANFASSMRYEDLPADVVHEAKRRVIDTLGCGIGGVDGPPARVARSLASRQHGTAGATVLGLDALSTAEMAAFANGIMVRYLDFNDGFGGGMGIGHPSDMIPAVLAVAEAEGKSGADALLGIAVAYEAAWAMQVSFMKLGWDQGVSMGLGVAAGAGSILRLNETEMANAISLAITPSLPLRVTRSGELSMWKGGAVAHACRNAVFGAYLAAEGMTAPDRPFEGRNGLWEQVTGPFEVDVDPRRKGFRIAASNMKGYPAAHMMHAVVDAMIDVRSSVGDVDDIESIDVRTYSHLIFESGGEPEKWDPQTRETADHSLPYVMAMALRDGRLTIGSFDREAVKDPSLRPLLAKIRITEEPAFSAARDDKGLPDSDPLRLGLSEIAIVKRSGERHTARTGITRGHHLNPMTDAEVEGKFRGLAEPISSSERIEAALEAIRDMDSAGSVASVIAAWSAMADPR